jgi:sigma-54 specific flagellar transcriptional regulator A
MTKATVFFGNSEAMRSLQKLLATCAGSDASVLLTGETGSGKEVMSRALHEQSPRRHAPFIPINCAAIPAALLESELFGYTKGAFTGAMSDRSGRIELANGGTLFLDEIGDMPLELQAKLLRVLEERVVEPLGSGVAREINVRVIAATHRDLNALVRDGVFREDLYFRLNVLPLRIPPVRERTGDILALCQWFAGRHARGQSPIHFTRRSATWLEAYAWPGNVREISNLMMRFSVIYSAQVIDLSRVPADLLPPGLWELIQRDCAQSADKVAVRDEADTPWPLQPLEVVSGAAEAGSAALADPISPRSIEQILRLSHSVSALPSEGVPARQLMADIEIQLIKAALAQAEGSVSKAAALLHLQRTTLIQKITRYNLNTSSL